MKTNPLLRPSKEIAKDVDMGPVPECKLKIAPAFYNTQVNLAGHFKTYFRHNKRTTLKIWVVVFCWATTSTINIKVMEDYSSTSFKICL